MIEYAAIIATLAVAIGGLFALDTIRKLRAKVEYAEWVRDDFIRQYDESQKQLRDTQATTARQAEVIGGLQSRLQEIADQETPSANATVKRMAAIARNQEYKHRETPNRVRDGYNSRTGRFVGKAKDVIGFQGTLDMLNIAPRQGEVLGEGA